jgi:hypothetical protein
VFFDEAELFWVFHNSEFFESRKINSPLYFKDNVNGGVNVDAVLIDV